MTNWPGRRILAIRGASTTRRTTFGESCSRSTTWCNGTSLVLVVTAGSSPGGTRLRYLPSAPRCGPKVTWVTGRRVVCLRRNRGDPLFPPILRPAPIPCPAGWCDVRSPDGGSEVKRASAARPGAEAEPCRPADGVRGADVGHHLRVTVRNRRRRSRGRCHPRGASGLRRGCRRTASAPSPSTGRGPGRRGRRSPSEAPATTGLEPGRSHPARDEHAAVGEPDGDRSGPRRRGAARPRRVVPGPDRSAAPWRPRAWCCSPVGPADHEEGTVGEHDAIALPGR